MKRIGQILPYIIIAVLLFFMFTNRWFDFDSSPTRTVETDSTTTIQTDSTSVDWGWIMSNIQPPDTVVKEVPVPVPSDIVPTDSVDTRTYEQSYRDSLIHAKWTTRVAGQMLGQEFSYVPQVQWARMKTVTKWRTRTNTLTKTVTITKNPGGYMTAGGVVGIWGDRAFVGPEVGWTSPRGDNFEVGYDPMNQGILFSGKIRISFRDLLGF